MAVDAEIEFDLDQLLKASAFLLGKSRIGLVYKVVLENGLLLALRRLEDKGWLRLKEFLADVEAMAKIKHPNVLSLKACCWSPEEKLLIYDYIPNGDLGSAIQGFGLGRIIDTSSEIRSDQISPMETSSQIVSKESYYQAPEAYSKMTKPSQKWDVYSFGLVILELVTGKSPVNSEMNLVLWVELASESNKPVLARDRDLEDSMVQVVEIGLACVQKNPDKRPLMRNVYESIEKLISSI